MGIKVTITEIAKELNVTPATVSRALRNHPGISTQMKDAVQKTANRLNYKKNTVATSLQSGKTNVIGVIVPSIKINFFGSVVHGIENIANSNGYNVLVYQSDENMEHEYKGIETFLSARVDGILISISKNTYQFEHFEEVKAKGVPLVFFDRTNDNLDFPSVAVDDFKGAFLATEHLIQQGYKTIAHISGSPNFKIWYNRLQGYLAALKKYQFQIDDKLIYEGNISIDSGKAAIQYFFQHNNPPDAIFAVEDFTALGALKELKNRNIKVPQEVGLIGFANESFGEHLTPSLSSIDQQTVLMGEKSIELLLGIIAQQNGGMLKKNKIVLDPLPVFRDSSKRLLL